MTDHQPVLLQEAVEALSPRAAGKYVDATYGRGGHARAVLQRLDEAGRLLVMDRDPQAVRHALAALGDDPRVTVRQCNFNELARQVSDIFGDEGVDGVLLDLGVSSPQLDTAARGFSFQADGPLDMRMDPQRGRSAAEWLADADEAEIRDVLWKYGEERHARRIARRLVAERAREPILSTARLAAVIAAATPPSREHKHPATRSFQAIRIHVNDELDALAAALRQAVEVLAANGRLCVISFHSLEDRLVKRFLRSASRPDPAYQGLPDMPPSARPVLRLIGKAQKPAAAECAANPRARSAVLRAAEKLPAPDVDRNGEQAPCLH